MMNQYMDMMHGGPDEGMLIGDGKLYLDDSGRVIKSQAAMERVRTKSLYPYNYSPFLIYGSMVNGCSCEYDDRLQERSYKKYEKIANKVFGNENRLMMMNKWEEFLREYCDSPQLSLKYIIEWCNASTGYPVWSYHFMIPNK